MMRECWFWESSIGVDGGRLVCKPLAEGVRGRLHSSENLPCHQYGPRLRKQGFEYLT